MKFIPILLCGYTDLAHVSYCSCTSRKKFFETENNQKLLETLNKGVDDLFDDRRNTLSRRQVLNVERGPLEVAEEVGSRLSTLKKMCRASRLAQVVSGHFEAYQNSFMGKDL